MFRWLSIPLLISFLLISSIGCSPKPVIDNPNEQKTVELLVSAASSLTEPMYEMKEVFEKEHQNIKLNFNFGGSGKLAQQIGQGAPVDIYISADPKWMDQLQQNSSIIPETRANVTSNKIVLIGGKNFKGDINTFKDISSQNIKQIAIGEPESVPAGKYTKQALKTIGQWKSVQSKLVFAKDVRQVLTYVESGNADIGFVYLSDALLSREINILAEGDDSWHTTIIYPAAVMVDSSHQDEAKQFVRFLIKEEAQRILEEYGFQK